MKNPSELVIVLILTALAAWLRIDHLVASNFVIDADEAIVGLMAKHITEGQAWPTFYYGQHYMGSFEAILVAGLFTVLGVSSVALKVVPLLFSLALVPVMYLLGRRFGGVWAARAAAVLIAIPPSSLVVWSTKARGGFIEILLLGALALLLVARWGDKQPQVRPPLFAALLLGLGWWINNQIIYFLLPILVWTIWVLIDVTRRARKRVIPVLLKQLALFVIFFFIGGLPYWIYNIQNWFISFEMFRSAGSKDLAAHFVGLYETALPILFGARGFWESNPLFDGAEIAVLILYGVILASVLVMRMRHFGDLLIFRTDRKVPLELIIGVLLCCIFVFSLSSFGYLVQAPRYLLPAYVPLFLIVGYFVARLHQVSSFMSLGVLALILSLNLASNFPGGERAIPGEPFVAKGERVSRDHSDLITWLDQQQINWVRTNYWIGYKLAFETNERVRFRVFQPPQNERIRSYIEESKVLVQEEIPLVVVPVQAAMIERALEALDVEYQREELSGYVVFYNLKFAPRTSAKLPATVHASHGETSAQLSLDDSIATRWGSATPQTPGMTFTVKFAEAVELQGVKLHMGSWLTDYPRELEIIGVTPSGEEVVLTHQNQARAIEFFYDWEEVIKILFAPTKVSELRFNQLGSHPIFDWSIAELEFLVPEPLTTQPEVVTPQ